MKWSAFAAAATLTGNIGGEQYESSKIIEQLRSGRLFFVTPEILATYFDTSIIDDKRFQWFITPEGEKQLRCDMLHFAWTDQASQLHEKLSTLRQHTNPIPIDAGESIRLPLLGMQSSHISGTIQKIGDVEQQTIDALYDAIVMNLRDQVEGRQYSDPLARKYFATAGVPTDVNANLLSMHMGKNPELIQYIVSNFGTYDEEFQETRTNFRGKPELESVFGEQMYFQEETPSKEFLTYLRATKDITPQKINEHNFPGLQVDIK